MDARGVFSSWATARVRSCSRRRSASSFPWAALKAAAREFTSWIGPSSVQGKDPSAASWLRRSSGRDSFLDVYPDRMRSTKAASINVER